VTPVADVNHAYFVHYVRSLPEFRSLKVLDFGCGGGELVRLLLDAGVDAYGAEVFYPGGSFDAVLASDEFKEGRIRRIEEDGRLPFESGSLEVVLSNQVFEHVEDLPAAVEEIHRVLGDRGIGYHHFPSREVLREGHIGIPLAHRLPPNALRFHYVRTLRALGFGSNKGDTSATDWTRRVLDWLDRFTCYRPYAEVRHEFERLFEVRHRELGYCRFRARGTRLATLLEIDALGGLYERTFRRLGFMALETTKR
jgi:SAM-dependent methyltransferase